MKRSTGLHRWVGGGLMGLAVVALLGCSSVENAGESEDQARTDGVEVGYGRQESDNLTGSVSSMSADEIEQAVRAGGITHVEELLRGRFPGVHVYRTGVAGFAVRIRGTSSFHGTNQPLYVIDGIPVRPLPGEGIVGINPMDIAAIDIIKDGMAAVYGSQGASGVVIITTKGAR